MIRRRICMMQGQGQFVRPFRQLGHRWILLFRNSKFMMFTG
jgi:hypothetical protein